MYKPYEWAFDEEVANEFENHVRKSVPMYEVFHSMISDMSKFFIEDNTNVLDIGTSTGELLKKLMCTKNCNYIGIDNQLAMVKKARSKLDKIYKIEHEDIVNYKLDNCSVITMVLVLQFIKQKDKQTVLDNIYKSLNVGGAFFFVDKIKASQSNINDIYNDMYYDFKIDNGLSPQEILSKNKSLRSIQKTMTLDENLILFKDAGFKIIDVFFKYNNFIGILAIK